MRATLRTQLSRCPLFCGRLLLLACIVVAASAFNALAQEGTCPDGGRPYFGVCPDGKAPTPGPAPSPSPSPPARPPRASPPAGDSPSGSPPAGDSPSGSGQWAATAHDEDFWAFSWQYNSEDDVHNAVMQECRKTKSNCEFVTATTGCIALARDADGVWGAWAARTTSSDADAAALATCKKTGRSGCHVPTIVCGATGKVRWESETADDGDTFSFEVCDDSSDKAFVAVSGRFAGDVDKWRVKGWWSVDPGKCKDIGKFERGEFYAMAEVAGNAERTWGNEDIKLCVTHPDAFDRVRGAHDTCKPKDLVGFQKFDINNATYTWHLKD